MKPHESLSDASPLVPPQRQVRLFSGASGGNLWHHREAAFASRHAGLAVEYARRQQVWWSQEARRFELVETEPAPLPRSTAFA
jgi:hypothetical protein